MYILLRLCLVYIIKLEQDHKTVRMEEKDIKSELSLGQKMMNVISSISVEPVMLLDGLAYANMIVLMETLQMDKICLNSLEYPAEICSNLSSYENETDY